MIGPLAAFASREHVGAAHFTAIGAFNEVTLGYFDRERRDYRKIPIGEQVEVLSLVGNVARHEERAQGPRSRGRRQDRRDGPRWAPAGGAR
ncbi:MAG: PCC domain-containing protein, partial [Candidatus Rokuibacteriota bacterium]